MSEAQFEITKENIDLYLKELAKEYRKQVGKAFPAELILIGGAAVLINYGFRDMTTDVDALIHASSGMKEAINCVGDRFGLPNGWLNADFKKTDSFSPKLAEFSVYYKTLSNVLTVRTIAAEYLIAMKLRSGRQYKSDLSDVIGILFEHEQRGTPIGMDQIMKAAADLYGNWETLPETSRTFIENVIGSNQLARLYEQTAAGEKETKELLLQFEQDYPGTMKEDNVDAIAGTLQQKTNRASILARLREKQPQKEAGRTSSPKKKDDLEQ